MITLNLSHICTVTTCNGNNNKERDANRQTTRPNLSILYKSSTPKTQDTRYRDMNVTKIELVHKESDTTNSSTKMSATSASGSSSEKASMLSPKQKEVLWATIPGNSKCCDCGQDKPEWASLNLATVMCLDCSGQHRGLGTHISFVRSIIMDSWTPSQIERMKLGGNDACKEFLISHDVDFDTLSIRQRYDTPAADLYQNVLKAKLNGTPIPTELPPPRVPKKPLTKKQMTGFGSSAHPRETRKQNRKKLAVVGSAIVSVAAVAWGLSRSGGKGGDAKQPTTSPTATATSRS